MQNPSPIVQYQFASANTSARQPHALSDMLFGLWTGFRFPILKFLHRPIGMMLWCWCLSALPMSSQLVHFGCIVYQWTCSGFFIIIHEEYANLYLIWNWILTLQPFRWSAQLSIIANSTKSVQSNHQSQNVFATCNKERMNRLIQLPHLWGTLP